MEETASIRHCEERQRRSKLNTVLLRLQLAMTQDFPNFCHFCHSCHSCHCCEAALPLLPLLPLLSLRRSRPVATFATLATAAQRPCCHFPLPLLRSSPATSSAAAPRPTSPLVTLVTLVTFVTAVNSLRRRENSTSTRILKSFLVLLLFHLIPKRLLSLIFLMIFY
jgi:hypothetical protein